MRLAQAQPGPRHPRSARCASTSRLRRVFPVAAGSARCWRFSCSPRWPCRAARARRLRRGRRFRTRASPRTTSGTTLGIVRPSNTLTITTAAFGTSSSLDFMRYAPGAPGATTYSVTPTACFNGVAFNPLPPPNAYGGGPIALGSVALVSTPTYHAGEPIFVRLTDADKNLNPAAIDSVVVNLAAPSSRRRRAGPAAGDGRLDGRVRRLHPVVRAARAREQLRARRARGPERDRELRRPGERGDTSSDSALIDPESRVFDSVYRRGRQRRAGDTDRRRDRAAGDHDPRRRRQHRPSPPR